MYAINFTSQIPHLVLYVPLPHFLSSSPPGEDVYWQPLERTQRDNLINLTHDSARPTEHGDGAERHSTVTRVL